jgi:protein-disulfide isomerase
MHRSRFAAAMLSLLLLALVGCQSQSAAKGEQPTSKPKILELEGVDTSKLTAREKEQWSATIGELLAPCPDIPVTLAQCIAEKRKCDACLPAARFLAQQVTKGKTQSQAEAAFRARFSPEEVTEIEVGASPGKGAAGAPVTIVEWADFECPFCAMASPLLAEAQKRHAANVRVIFKHYPLSAHEHAEGAARAAVAAGLQGKFWEMHDRLFAGQAALDDNALVALAKDLDLDLEKFDTDRKSEAVADAVAADRKQADKLGLRGTPTIYINGRHFDLEKFDLTEDLDPWIELEVAARSGKAALAEPAAEPTSALEKAGKAPANPKPIDKPVAVPPTAPPKGG